MNTYYLNLNTKENDTDTIRLSLSSFDFAIRHLDAGYSYKGVYKPWPDFYLHPTAKFDDPEFLEKITFMFFDSALCIYAHEFIHAFHEHVDSLINMQFRQGLTSDTLNKFKIAQELEADLKSIQLLCNTHDPKCNFALAMLVRYSANYLLITNKEPKDHINLFDRFDLIFDEIILDENSILWLIPVFIFVPEESISCDNSSLNILSSKETPKSMYKKMLEYRRKNNT